MEEHQLPIDPPGAPPLPDAAQAGTEPAPAAQASPQESAAERIPGPEELLRAAELNLHQPTLDDVILAKTGRKLEGAGDDD